MEDAGNVPSDADGDKPDVAACDAPAEVADCDTSAVVGDSLVPAELADGDCGGAPLIDRREAVDEAVSVADADVEADAPLLNDAVAVPLGEAAALALTDGAADEDADTPIVSEAVLVGVASGVGGAVGAPLGEEERVPVVVAVAADEPVADADDVAAEVGVAPALRVTVAIEDIELDAEAPPVSEAVDVAVAAAVGDALMGLMLVEALRLCETLLDALPVNDALGHESAAREKFFATAGAGLLSTNWASVLLFASSACRTWPFSHVVQQSTRPQRLMLPKL